MGCVDDHNNSVVYGISKPTTLGERKSWSFFKVTLQLIEKVDFDIDLECLLDGANLNMTEVEG